MSNVVINIVDTASWKVFRGQDAALLLVFQTDLGASAVASGTTWKCTFRTVENDTAAIAVDLATGSGIVSDSNGGTVTLLLADTQTAALATGTLYGQLWRNDSGVKQCVARLELTVLERVTVI